MSGIESFLGQNILLLATLCIVAVATCIWLYLTWQYGKALEAYHERPHHVWIGAAIIAAKVPSMLLISIWFLFSMAEPTTKISFLGPAAAIIIWFGFVFIIRTKGYHKLPMVGRFLLAFSLASLRQIQEIVQKRIPELEELEMKRHPN